MTTSNAHERQSQNEKDKADEAGREALYLSRLVLNPRNGCVRRDVADCQSLHMRVMSVFPDVEGEAARSRLGVLFRLETKRASNIWVLLVQSRVAPQWERLPDDYQPRGFAPNPVTKRIDVQFAAIAEGQRLRFLLRANPTRKVGKTQDDPLRGKRVDLRGEADRLAWLERKGRDGGFALVAVETHNDIQFEDETRIWSLDMQPEAKITGRREALNSETRKRGMTFGSVLFEGELVVTDRGKFQVSLAEGIGTGKAYGFGLLSVAPVR